MRFRSFNPDLTAEFSGRPNRFIVMARSNGEQLKVHCPNPGRLREILLPGRKLILEKSDKPERKTRWTLGAAIYRDTAIPLVSSRANGLIGKLVLPELFPGRRLEAEQKLGASRMDWLISGNIWAEVKACTLVEQGRALFPDAPSTRAVKHLNELINPGEGNRSAVFFTVMSPSAQVFSPNPHTDPELCAALGHASESGVMIRAVSVRTEKDGWSTVVNSNLPVDLTSVKLAKDDCGVILRVWENLERKGSHYRVNYELHRENLKQAEKRKIRHDENIRDGFHPSVSLTIRGPVECFSRMDPELAEFDFTDNPLFNPLFIDWVSDYRHRRVFFDDYPAGVVTPMK